LGKSVVELNAGFDRNVALEPAPSLHGHPGGIVDVPPTKTLFQNTWEVEQT
jgi:hypothetical protein